MKILSSFDNILLLLSQFPKIVLMAIFLLLVFVVILTLIYFPSAYKNFLHEKKFSSIHLGISVSREKNSQIEITEGENDVTIFAMDDYFIQQSRHRFLHEIIYQGQSLSPFDQSFVSIDIGLQNISGSDVYVRSFSVEKSGKNMENSAFFIITSDPFNRKVRQFEVIEESQVGIEFARFRFGVLNEDEFLSVRERIRDLKENGELVDANYLELLPDEININEQVCEFSDFRCEVPILDALQSEGIDVNLIKKINDPDIFFLASWKDEVKASVDPSIFNTGSNFIKIEDKNGLIKEYSYTDILRMVDFLSGKFKGGKVFCVGEVRFYKDNSIVNVMNFFVSTHIFVIPNPLSRLRSVATYESTLSDLINKNEIELDQYIPRGSSEIFTLDIEIDETINFEFEPKLKFIEGFEKKFDKKIRVISLFPNTRKWEIQYMREKVENEKIRNKKTNNKIMDFPSGRELMGKIDRFEIIDDVIRRMNTE